MRKLQFTGSTNLTFHPEDGGSMGLRNVGVLPHHNTTLRHNPEDLDLNAFHGNTPTRTRLNAYY